MLVLTLVASNKRNMPHVFQVLSAGLAAADIWSVGRISAVVYTQTAEVTKRVFMQLVFIGELQETIVRCNKTAQKPYKYLFDLVF